MFSRSISESCVSPEILLMDKNPAITTWDVKQKPVNNGINYLSTRAGFLPSTVWIYYVRYVSILLLNRIVDVSGSILCKSKI